MRVQRRRGGDDDEQDDEIGNRHTDNRDVGEFARACSGARVSGRARAPSFVSSTCCPVCQKNSKGLIVAPSMATIAIRYSAFNNSGGHTMAQK
jgi:hypothetical protein